MQIREVTTEVNWGFGFEDAPDPDRPRGLHFSTVLQSLCEESGILAGTGLDDDKTRQVTEAKIEMGLAFETTLEEALNRRATSGVRPLAIEHLGIWHSADRVSWDLGRLVGEGPILMIEEYKYTWYSARREIEDRVFWRWWIQLGAYCAAHGTPYGLLRVCFVNGFYKPPRPVRRAWARVYAQQELADIESMIVGHARRKGWLP